MKRLLLILLLLSPLALRGAVATNPIVAANPTTMTNIVLAITAPQTNVLYNTLTNRIAASTNQFISPVSAMTVPATNYAHGLGRTPTEVRLVLVCTNSDAATGYVAGDEINAWALQDSFQLITATTVWQNTASVGYGCVDCGDRVHIAIQKKDGTDFFNMTSVTNFNLKIYAR